MESWFSEQEAWGRFLVLATGLVQTPRLLLLSEGLEYLLSALASGWERAFVV